MPYLLILPQYFSTFFPDWLLVKEKTECRGKEINEGYLATVDECSRRCKGKSSMFIFGTNDYNLKRCKDDGSEYWKIN